MLLLRHHLEEGPPTSSLCTYWSWSWSLCGLQMLKRVIARKSLLEGNLRICFNDDETEKVAEKVLFLQTDLYPPGQNLAGGDVFYPTQHPHVLLRIHNCQHPAGEAFLCATFCWSWTLQSPSSILLQRMTSTSKQADCTVPHFLPPHTHVPGGPGQDVSGHPGHDLDSIEGSADACHNNKSLTQCLGRRGASERVWKRRNWWEPWAWSSILVINLNVHLVLSMYISRLACCINMSVFYFMDDVNIHLSLDRNILRFWKLGGLS